MCNTKAHPEPYQCGHTMEMLVIKIATNVGWSSLEMPVMLVR
jgi:hypothetical protein